MSQAVATYELCDQFKITEREVRARLALLNFTPEDEEHLRQIHLVITDEVDAIIAGFYGHLTRFEELDRFLSDKQTIERLKITQRRYLLSLGRQFATLEYFEDRLRIGITHERIGLQQKWYLSAYSTLYGLIAGRVANRHADDPAKLVALLASLQKILTLDSTLAVETHYHATTQRLETLLHDSAASQHSLKEESHLDSLTQVKNRKFLLETLELEFHRSRRFLNPLTLLFVDIDHFKTINDTYGHTGGDTVLKNVVQILSEAIRPADIIGRYGGEEFVVGLLETDETMAKEIAERLRLKVALGPVTLGHHTVSATISIGLASLKPGIESIEDLIERADSAMYKAKKAGRNQVCVSQEVKCR